MPTQSSGSHELTIIPFAPVPVTVRDDADQLPKQHNLFCNCLIAQLVLLKKIVNAR